ncbi:MAG: hypothetical protein ABSA97_06700 [Verrucomicrobiia bacterium]|jgi:type II secretory pathway pseudopilin PulG
MNGSCHKPGGQRSAVSDQLSECSRAFTLFELLASIGILAILSALLFAAFNQASKAWLQSESRVETFQQARAALDYISKELSQAIVTSNITFLGSSGSVAFVAPVNDGTNAVDLMEIVYRLSVPAPNPALPDPLHIFVDGTGIWPKKLVRRASYFAALPIEGWDYGQGASCLVTGFKPWDFYVNPTTALRPNPDWPETSATNRIAVLAENITYLQFLFVDANGNPPSPNYWNSNSALPSASWSHELNTPIPPASLINDTVVMTNRAPAGVYVTIGVMDSRTVARWQTLTYNSPDWNRLFNQGTRYFTTFVAIPSGTRRLAP